MDYLKTPFLKMRVIADESLPAQLTAALLGDLPRWILPVKTEVPMEPRQPQAGSPIFA